MKIIITVPTKDGKIDANHPSVRDLIPYCDRSRYVIDVRDELFIPEDDGRRER